MKNLAFDFEFIKINNEYHPVQYGFTRGTTKGSSTLPIDKHAYSYYNADPTLSLFFQKHKQEHLITNAVAAGQKGNISGTRTKFVQDILKQFEQTLESGGNILHHSVEGVDFEVLNSLMTNMSPIDKQTTQPLLHSLQSKLGEEAITLKNGIGKFNLPSVQALFPSSNIKSEQFAFYSNKFNKLMGQYRQGGNVVNTLELAQSVIGMGETSGALRSIQMGEHKYSNLLGTSIESLSKIYDINVATLHDATSDASVLNKLVSQLAKTGEDIQGGNLTLDIADRFNKERVRKSIANKVKTFEDYMLMNTNHENVIEDFVKSTPFYDTDDSIELFTHVKNLHSTEQNKLRGSILANQNKVNELIEKTTESVVASSAKHEVDKAIYMGSKRVGMHESAFAARRSQRIAQGAEKLKQSSLGKFFKSKPGKFVLGGAALFGALKLMNNIRQPDFEKMMEPEYSDTEKYLPHKSMYPEYNPNRIHTTNGFSGVQSKYMAGFGSPMVNSIRKGIERHAPRRKLKSMLPALMDMPFQKIQREVPDFPLLGEAVEAFQAQELPRTVAKRKALAPTYSKAVAKELPSKVVTHQEASIVDVLHKEYDVTMAMAVSSTTQGGNDQYQKMVMGPIVPWKNVQQRNLEINPHYSGLNLRNQTLATDFSSPAERGSFDRWASADYLRRITSGYKVEVLAKMQGLQSKHLEQLAGTTANSYGLRQKFKIINDTFLYNSSKAGNHLRQILVMNELGPTQKMDLVRRRAKTRLDSMVYYTDRGMSMVRPLDIIYNAPTHLNYSKGKNKNVFKQTLNQGSLGMAY